MLCLPLSELPEPIVGCSLKSASSSSAEIEIKTLNEVEERETQGYELRSLVDEEGPSRLGL